MTLLSQGHTGSCQVTAPKRKPSLPAARVHGISMTQATGRSQLSEWWWQWRGRIPEIFTGQNPQDLGWDEK